MILLCVYKYVSAISNKCYYFIYFFIVSLVIYSLNPMEGSSERKTTTTNYTTNNIHISFKSIWVVSFKRSKSVACM